jgi:hypothetical protein
MAGTLEEPEPTEAALTLRKQLSVTSEKDLRGQPRLAPAPSSGGASSCGGSSATILGDGSPGLRRGAGKASSGAIALEVPTAVGPLRGFPASPARPESRSKASCSLAPILDSPGRASPAGNGASAGPGSAQEAQRRWLEKQGSSSAAYRPAGGGGGRPCGGGVNDYSLATTLHLLPSQLAEEEKGVGVGFFYPAGTAGSPSSHGALGGGAAASAGERKVPKLSFVPVTDVRTVDDTMCSWLSELASGGCGRGRLRRRVLVRFDLTDLPPGVRSVTPHSIA